MCVLLEGKSDYLVSSGRVGYSLDGTGLITCICIIILCLTLLFFFELQPLYLFW